MRIFNKTLLSHILCDDAMSCIPIEEKMVGIKKKIKCTHLHTKEEIEKYTCVTISSF